MEGRRLRIVEFFGPGTLAPLHDSADLKRHLFVESGPVFGASAFHALPLPGERPGKPDPGKHLRSRAKRTHDRIDGRCTDAPHGYDPESRR